MDLGPVDGAFPSRDVNKPNWVSTTATSETHKVEPINCGNTDPKAVLKRIVAAAAAMPGAQVVTQTDNYAHLEFSSRLFRFIDDVEFAIGDGGGVIHMRGAARSGYSDFDVNRTRIEQLRQQLAEH